jgi:hypothetical protein
MNLYQISAFYYTTLHQELIIAQFAFLNPYITYTELRGNLSWFSLNTPTDQQN